MVFKRIIDHADQRNALIKSAIKIQNDFPEMVTEKVFYVVSYN